MEKEKEKVKKTRGPKSRCKKQEHHNFSSGLTLSAKTMNIDGLVRVKVGFLSDERMIHGDCNLTHNFKMV